MGVNRVEMNGETLLDLTGDTVSAETLIAGATAHNAAGEKIAGTAVIPTKISQLTNDSNFITAADIYNPNFIVNPDFRVNSKGQSEYSGVEGPDRWFSLVGHKVTVLSEGIRVTCTANANRGVSQVFEHALDPGKYTASVKVTDISGTLIFLIGGGKARITQSGTYQFTVDQAAKTEGITLQVPNIGEWAEIAWVKIEFGGNMTPFFPPNSNLERLKCGVFDGITAERTVSNAANTLKAETEEAASAEVVPTKVAEIAKPESELKAE